jgi:cytidine deaminase
LKTTDKTSPIEELDKNTRILLKLALKARKRAHAPYSKYRVGAALIDGKGRLHTGCNVENASYGGSICAERVALCKMVSRGARDVREIVVVASSEEPVFPCGICLQFLREFGKNVKVTAVNQRSTVFRQKNLHELFPYSFSSEKLRG